MKYNYNEEIDYEYEACTMVCRHYNEKECYQAQYQYFLNKKTLAPTFVDDLMKPLLEIEEAVFKKITISEKDYQLYFKRYDSYDEESIYDIDLGFTITFLNKINISSQAEEKKIFLSLLFNELGEEELQAIHDEASFLSFLKQREFSATMKWNLFDVYTNMKEHKQYVKNLISPIVSILKTNEHILKKIITNNPYKENLHFLKEKGSFSNLINQRAIVRFSVMGFNEISFRELKKGKKSVSTIYYGAYVDILINEENKQNHVGDIVANKLKSLSDKSRLKILCQLKQQEMCGQELKEALALSNATISHHMNALMSESFVKTRKEGNKVVYSLNKEVIEEALDTLHKLLIEG